MSSKRHEFFFSMQCDAVYRTKSCAVHAFVGIITYPDDRSLVIVSDSEPRTSLYNEGVGSVSSAQRQGDLACSACCVFERASLHGATPVEGVHKSARSPFAGSRHHQGRVPSVQVIIDQLRLGRRGGLRRREDAESAQGFS
eukprot:6173683-Pleurochrysis_carterae.AAC.5